MKRGAEKLVKIEPFELKFAFEPNKQMSCSLYLSNTTNNLVAFQVLATDASNYTARPNNGIILPHRTCGIKVKTQAQMKLPADMKCNDLIKIESVVFTQCANQDMKQLFNKKEDNYVEEYTLAVVYLYEPLLLSPLPKLNYILLTENGNLNHSQMMMSTKELLKIDQQELNFLFEVNKQISCSLQLRNVTETYVAFEVKATHPKKFWVRPNRGILLPGSSCDVTVTMLAQKALSNVQHEEFLIRSTILSPGTIEEVVDREMMISTNEPLKINKPELIFPSEANKYSHYLQLPNRTDSYVAFKVKATHPKKFCIQPSRGISFPGSSCHVIVTMQPHKVLSNIQHNEKFLIQGVVLSPKTIEEIVDWEMLNDAGGLIREYKLRGAYTFTHQAPFSVAAELEECSSKLAFVGNDNLDGSQECLLLHSRRNNIRHVSSAFGKILDSLGLVSRNKYKRL